MAQKSGKAGKSTFAMANQRKWRQILYPILGILAVIVIYLLMTNAKGFGIGGGVLILALFYLMHLIPNIVEQKTRQKYKEEKRAIRGAVAEERIEGLLDALDENFVVIHDIANQYGNIDHVVISREGGIFLIETKSHGGRVELVDGGLLVNGRQPEKDFIAQVLRNTYWLRDQAGEITGTRPWITPMIVFTNAFVRGNLKIKGITILNKRFLVSVQMGQQQRNKDAKIEDDSKLKVWICHLDYQFPWKTG